MQRYKTFKNFIESYTRQNLVPIICRFGMALHVFVLFDVLYTRVLFSLE
jgi:hypothetical protein